jgi:hypothetical protein
MMSLPTAQLGTTDMEITRIGLSNHGVPLLEKAEKRRTTSRTAGPSEAVEPLRIAHQGRNRWFLPGDSNMRQCLAKGDGYA